MGAPQKASRGQSDSATMSNVHPEPFKSPADSDGMDPTTDTRARYMATGPAVSLSQEHQDYLIKRHGTLYLDPVPSDDPADPYNWPEWKKMANLIVVGFNAMMTTFTAAAIIPAYEAISEEFECTITKASYLTSLQIMVLGWAPLFWKPLSQRYGRRPIWLISMLGSLVFNVGCALSHSYSTMAICRAFVSFFLCPAMAYGSGVVTETYFKGQRAQYMGVWTLLVTLGAPSGPFIMGFVSYQTGNYRWIYWTLAILNGVHFLAYCIFGPETRYLRRGVTHRGSAFAQEYLQFRRIDPAPFRIFEFIQPLSLARYASIAIPAVAYAVVFNFTSVLLTVEIPQLFIPKFGFNSQQLGLQFLGIIIGSIIGEQLGGRLSDLWMRRIGGRKVATPPPEFRLWLSYGGFLLAMVGLIIFGVRFEQAEQNHWNVTPIIGIAIAAVGNQIVTTVLVTYAVDCHVEHSASIGIFINVVRQTWGFIGPFFFPEMLADLGTVASVGLLAGLIFAVCWVPTAVLQWRGQKWRDAGPAPIVMAEDLKVAEKEATGSV